MAVKKDNITKADVRHMANLSQLDLKEDEESKFAEMFSDTLGYIEVLEELDTKNVSETYQVTGLENVYQEGAKNEATLTKKETLQNAKEVEDSLIVSKGVFDR